MERFDRLSDYRDENGSNVEISCRGRMRLAQALMTDDHRFEPRSRPSDVFSDRHQD
jgi:hypothetical protein